MLRKKLYIPIGFCIVLVAVGLFFLCSQTPQETVKVYKVTKPAADTETEKNAQDGHFHEDGTFHAEPHEPKNTTTPQQVNSFPQVSKQVAELQRQLQEAKQQQKAAEAITAAAKAELAALKEQDAEFSEILSVITEKARAIAETDFYAAVLGMTPEKFIGLSESDKADFLLHCADYDIAVDEIKQVIVESPQWAIDRMKSRRPETINSFINAPSLILIYGRL